MDKETRLKIKISEAATDRYLENPRFTIQSLAKTLKMSSSDIFDLFPNRRSILEYFYESRMILYRDSLSEIEDYQNFSLGEKLNHLFLTLLDAFETNREFVLTTYKEWIVYSQRWNAFRKHFKEALKEIFQQDSEISRTSTLLQNELLWKSILLQFHGLIAFWAKDSSRMRENSMALADKWSAFIEEIFYTKIIDKGFDLGKYLWMNSSLNRCMNSVEFKFPDFNCTGRESGEMNHE